jgi:hypothetical protein
MKNNITLRLNLANSTVADLLENSEPNEFISLITDDTGAPVKSMALNIIDDNGISHIFGISNTSISYSVVNP